MSIYKVAGDRVSFIHPSSVPVFIKLVNKIADKKGSKVNAYKYIGINRSVYDRMKKGHLTLNHSKLIIAASKRK